MAPRLTRDGHALLLINPHTSFYFRSELQMTSDEGLNAYGASTWGQFFIYQGFNPRVGWMHTSSGVDSVDEFGETIVTRGGAPFYRYGKDVRPLARRPVTIAYRKADGSMATRRFVTMRSHHGPIVAARDGKWIATALMWKPVPALEQSWLRTKAVDLHSYLTVSARQANSSNATILADAKGQIAYLHPQFVPVRDNRFDYTRVVDGSDPATDWRGLHPLSTLPQAISPPTQLDDEHQQLAVDRGRRGQPARRRLPALHGQRGRECARGARLAAAGRGAAMTPQKLMTLAYDSYLPAFATLIPQLVAAHDALPASDPQRARLAAPIKLLRDWDRRWSATSEATSLAVFWGDALGRDIGAQAKAARLQLPDYIAARVSPAAKLAALDQAVATLARDFGDWRVAWGRINRFQRLDARIAPHFDDAKPSIAVPFTSAQWGSLASYGARSYDNTKRYYGTSGNSFVAVVEFGPRLRAWAVMAGGQSGNPTSRHFADQVEPLCHRPIAAGLLSSRRPEGPRQPPLRTGSVERPRRRFFGRRRATVGRRDVANERGAHGAVRRRDFLCGVSGKGTLMSSKLLLRLAASASIVALGACATTAVEPTAPAVAQAPVAVEPVVTQASAHDRLFELFKASDEANLQRNPLNALSRGDLRYADRMGDFISDEYLAAEKAAGEADLAALRAIPRDSLNETDQIAYDVFEFSTRENLRGFAPDLLALTVVRPMNHFFGFHTFYPTFASGKGTAPFKTLADYENNLKRHRDFVVYIDRAIERFRQGKASGVVETKLTVRNMIAQLDTQLKQKVEDSAYYGPIKAFPAEVAAADRTRLASEYRAAISGQLYPVLTRLRDFLKTEYLPVARDGAGLMYMKGGERLYQELIEQTTTLPLKADEIHQLGLSEVARIKNGMEEVKREVGFKGTLAQFFDHLRTDPKFKEKTREVADPALLRHRQDRRRASCRPISRPFPSRRWKSAPTSRSARSSKRAAATRRAAPTARVRASSTSTPTTCRRGPRRGSPRSTSTKARRGITSRSAWRRKIRSLPSFMRFGGNTAYVEGWALYAETLGYDMGLYNDPYQRFGTLSDEMLRAMRLVVDTGIHSKGWTREKAIDYMLANSDMGRTDATAEVERYIAIPSQALAYKIGALTIQRLRKKAEAELGTKFDIRAFHAQVLMTGSLPLPILEKKIDRWIAVTKAS